MLHTLRDVLSHLDHYLAVWSASLGPSLYAVLFLVIFCETGLVVTPFLPGDSLLFSVGVVAALPNSGIDLVIATVLLSIAAILGDSVNYKIGAVIGERAFKGEFKYIKKAHLERTKSFYERYGGRAIVLARFAPVLRTFAPFVAGFAQMPYPRFFKFNVSGGIAWVTICTVSGYLLANVKFVKEHFEAVLVAIIVVSLLPAIFEAIRAQRPPNGAANT